MAKVTIEYLGMPGSGATVTEAKRDAGRRIEEALEGDYSPIVAQWRDHAVLAFRHPRYEWGYRFLNDSAVQSVSHCCSGYTSKEECLRAMLIHIADIGMSVSDTPESIDPLFASYFGLKQREIDEIKAEYARRLAYHQEVSARMAEAESIGLSGEDARDYAMRNPARRELWEKAAA